MFDKKNSFLSNQTKNTIERILVKILFYLEYGRNKTKLLALPTNSQQRRAFTQFFHKMPLGHGGVKR